MLLSDIMVRLESLGSAKVRERNARNDAGYNQFGVQMGDIRKLAREIKLNPALAAELWATGNVDARLLAILLMRPPELSADEVERMVLEATYPQLADWLNAYVVKAHPLKEQFRKKWMNSDQATTARAGWSLTAERVAKDPEGLGLSALLDRIEKEMAGAPALVQWTMNYCLAEIGIHFADHRERAVAIGHKLGVFRDFPTSKGCTSPFAPIWIAEMASRQKS
jgi:3-methyladenine DNA glycosylase AlkD